MITKKLGQPLIHNVLQLHDNSSSTKTKSCILGDGYLYHQNPVFRHFRDRLFEMGYQLSAENAARYNGWPLMALDEALRSKKLTYIDNVYYIRELEKTRPKHFFIEDIVDFGPKKIPILHESAHCLADQINKRISKGQKLKMDSRQDIAKILISESFALAVEALSTLYLKNEPIEIFFHKLSIHVYSKNFKSDPLNTSHRQFGLRPTFRIVFACYLYTNFLYRELGDSEVRNILAFSDIPNNSKFNRAGLVRNIFKKAREVGGDFQLKINSRYLKMHGHDGNILKILNFDPIGYCDENQKISALTDALTNEISLIEN